MIRRWLTRGLWIAILSLFIVFWIVSYFDMVFLQFNPNGQVYQLDVESGCLVLSNFDEVVDEGVLNWFYLPANPDLTNGDYVATKYHCFGFACSLFFPPGHYVAIYVPSWFVTLLCALLFLADWRRTMNAPQRGAFPVEPTAQ